jgi:hypothetical protein
MKVIVKEIRHILVGMVIVVGSKCHHQILSLTTYHDTLIKLFALHEYAILKEHAKIEWNWRTRSDPRWRQEMNSRVFH